MRRFDRMWIAAPPRSSDCAECAAPETGASRGRSAALPRHRKPIGLMQLRLRRTPRPDPAASTSIILLLSEPVLWQITGKMTFHCAARSFGWFVAGAFPDNRRKPRSCDTPFAMAVKLLRVLEHSHASPIGRWSLSRPKVTWARRVAAKHNPERFDTLKRRHSAAKRHRDADCALSPG